MLLLGLISALAIAGQTPPPVYFPDIPDNHWAFEALAGLKKDGILRHEPTMTRFGNRPTPRAEIADCISATVEGLPEDRATIDGLWERHPNYEFTYVRNRISNLKKLIKTFSVDLESQGKHPEALQGKVREVLGSFEVEIYKHLPTLRKHGGQQFIDLPKGHWAYDATYDLKLLGILQGYGYKRYHG